MCHHSWTWIVSSHVSTSPRDPLDFGVRRIQTRESESYQCPPSSLGSQVRSVNSSPPVSVSRTKQNDQPCHGLSHARREIGAKNQHERRGRQSTQGFVQLCLDIRQSAAGIAREETETERRVNTLGCRMLETVPLGSLGWIMLDLDIQQASRGQQHLAYLGI